MDKASLVKDDIIKLVGANFGDVTASAFLESYDQETLPILTDGALKILSDLIGRERAKAAIHSIYARHSMVTAYV